MKKVYSTIGEEIQAAKRRERILWGIVTGVAIAAVVWAVSTL